MNVQLSRNDAQARIALSGRFDFNCHRAFRAACDSVLGDEAAAQIHIDLRAVAYIDSSALGMLLLLRDKARAAGKEISIGTQPGTVRDILGIAHFDDLFALQ